MLEHSNRMANRLYTSMLCNNCKETERTEINNVVSQKVESTVTTKFNLDMAEDIISVISDLDIELLNNKTSANFITSDVPLIVVNPLIKTRAGLGDIGTVIFFPISPKRMIILYDKKFYGKLNSDIFDINVILDLNKYQYISGSEMIMGLNTLDFTSLIKDDDLERLRKTFQSSTETGTYDVGSGVFAEVKPRNMGYYFDIPFLCVPRELRKIPQHFRDTISRQYKFENRLSLLYRIYFDVSRIKDNDERDLWKQKQRYWKKLLDYCDFYWHTPKEDLFISSNLFQQIKSMPFEHFSFNRIDDKNIGSVEVL